MKRLVLTVFLCISGVQVLFAQDLSDKNNPDEQIIVNKEYDENGNLTQYDSTYVQQWSSDSTIVFPFNDHFVFNGDIQNFMNKIFGDSTIAGFGIAPDFSFSPFNDEDFINPFNFSFPDSLMLRNFQFDYDSLLNRNFSFHQPFPHHFDFPDLDEIHKQMQEHLKQFGYQTPDLKSKEQQEEWEQLMQKQQKEKEELLKKWEKEK